MGTRKRKAPPVRRIDCDEATMAIFNRVAARMREARDAISAELERDGVRVLKKGTVEVKLEPFKGCASVELKNWIFEVKE